MAILYIHPVIGYDGRPSNNTPTAFIMTSEQWTSRCAEQLLQQWPRVDRSDLEHLASALWTEPRWQSMEPSAAAIEWIAQGIPSTAQAAH